MFKVTFKTIAGSLITTPVFPLGLVHIEQIRSAFPDSEIVLVDVRESSDKTVGESITLALNEEEAKNCLGVFDYRREVEVVVRAGQFNNIQIIQPTKYADKTYGIHIDVKPTDVLNLWHCAGCPISVNDTEPLEYNLEIIQLDKLKASKPF